jgi:hypothetical protein
MAHYFLTASKDASVYLQQPNQNTGLDEILEVSKVYYGNVKDISRAFLKFDTEYLSASIAAGNISLDEALLILKETKSEELPLEYTIYGYPVSQSWEMGIGTRFDNISTQGITWNYREGDSELEWLPAGTFANGSSGSYDGQGGVWYYTSTYSASQSYNYQTADLQMNVKSMFKAWISGSIKNDGIVVKHIVDFENDVNDYGILKFFSKETNTIYQPKIRIGWDDQIFQTGSLTQLTSDDIKVGIKNLKSSYKVNTNQKIRIIGRELYPLKTFVNSFAYNDTMYLPTSSYYQIRDYISNDVIVPFGEYSKISCDSDGNFIKLNFSNWEANRTYKIEFKVVLNGNEQYFDEKICFTLEKN